MTSTTPDPSALLDGALASLELALGDKRPATAEWPAGYYTAHVSERQGAPSARTMFGAIPGPVPQIHLVLELPTTEVTRAVAAMFNELEGFGPLGWEGEIGRDDETGRILVRFTATVSAQPGGDDEIGILTTPEEAEGWIGTGFFVAGILFSAYQRAEESQVSGAG